MLAAIVQAPELELAEAEAKALARGIETVAKHYPVELSPKRLAWGNLTLVAGSIYGPRAILLFQRARGNVADVAPTAMAMPAAMAMPGQAASAAAPPRAPAPIASVTQLHASAAPGAMPAM